MITILQPLLLTLNRYLLTGFKRVLDIVRNV